MSTKNFLVALALVSASAQYTINNGATGATYTCSAAATNTGIDFVGSTVRCAKGFFYTAPNAAVGGTCTACTGAAAPGATVTGADLWTCTLAAGAIVSIPAIGGCKAGFYHVAGASGSADTCVQCTSAEGKVATLIDNAATGATYTCTAANTGIEFATGECKTGYFYTAASGAAAGASCVACTGAAAPAATVTGASWWTCATSAGAIIRIPKCNSGYGRTAGATSGTITSDVCTQCTSTSTPAVATATSIDNALTGSTYTCLTTTATTNRGIDFEQVYGSFCKAGYYYTAADGDTAASCKVCTSTAAPGTTVAGSDWWTCTSGATGIRDDQYCNAGYYLVESTTTPGDTCVQCTSAASTVASSIANAATGAKYTCTAANTGIEFADGSVKCKSGYFYTPASGTAAGATCTACTGIAAPGATVAGAADFTCTAAAGAIVSIPSCKSGFLKVASGTAPGDTCFACTGGYVAPAGQSSAMAVSGSIALLMSVAVAALSL